MLIVGHTSRLLELHYSLVFWCCLTHHYKPRDEGCIPNIPETAVINVWLHLQKEEETLVDDIGNPAETSRDTAH